MYRDCLPSRTVLREIKTLAAVLTEGIYTIFYTPDGWRVIFGEIPSDYRSIPFEASPEDAMVAARGRWLDRAKEPRP